MIRKSVLATRINNLNKSSLLLIASFSAILIVTVTALGLVLHQTKTTQFQANEIVTSNNKKAKLLVDMQQIARERSLALYRMINIKDPFEYDDIQVAFRHYAELFIKARQTFVQMSLSEDEKHLIESQSRLSGIAVPIQHQIIDLLNQEKYAAANQLLVQKAIPAQDAVLNELSKLLKLQYDNNKKIIIELQNKLNQHIVIIILSALVIFILTILVAYKVINKISQTEKQLFYEKELAQITLHSIGDGVITVDKNYLIKTINPVAEMLVGKNRHSLTGRNISSIYDNTKEKQQSIADESLRQISIQRSLFDFTFIHHDGAKFEVENTIAPIIDPDKNILGAVIILRDVTEMRSMEKRLSYQASHDSLTKLINRREFEIRLEQTIRNAHTEHNSHSICFLDLDKFKIINDTSGHAAGDEFLKQISKTIHTSLRQTDVLARLGGDEFGIILDCCSISSAKNICNEIISNIRDTRFNWGKNSFESGASIGIVPINKYTTSVSEVMSSVDAACYEAKDKGRNRIQVFEPDDAEFVKHRIETSWVQKIKKGIAKNNFELYYQEILAINPRYPTPKTVEILVRLNDAGNIIEPDSFIPTAERYNMMSQIDEWVIENTFNFLYEYQKTIQTDLRVAINLSGQSLSEDSVLNLITTRLRKNKTLNKKCICFEITETAAIANMSRATEFIASIKQMGCQFSLDDFGSGLSSFSYLKNMAVDNLKIDGVFIRDINADPINQAFVESIHNIGKMMGIKTTAEYVENEEIYNCVKSIGIDYAQGHYISKPQPMKNLLIK